MARGNVVGTQQNTTQVPAQAPAAAVAPPAPRREPLTLKTLLEKSVDRLAEVLPKHMTPDRVIHVVNTLVYRTPKLQECDPYSILASVMQAAALGLDLSPTMGEAYLVPVWNEAIRGKECQFRPGYRGLAKLVRNSGAAVDLWAEVVYQADVFVYRHTPALEFLHEPYRGRDRGPVTDAYAVAELSPGKYRIAVMSADEIEAIHQRSEGFKYARREGKAEFGPWVTDTNEMRKKTVIRRLCKGLPMSTQLADAIASEDRDYATVVGSPGEIEARGPARRGLAGLSDRLQIEEAALPPQPSVVYSETDDIYDDPEGEPQAEDVDATEAGSRG